MEQQKHSGLGIASFITSIASGIVLILLFVIAGAIDLSTPEGLDEESAGVAILGFSLLALLGASLASLGLGIGGLVQKERKNIFAIIGTVFATTTIVMVMLTLVMCQQRSGIPDPAADFTTFLNYEIQCHNPIR